MATALKPVLQQAVEALQAGNCIAILDDEKRESETDLFFPAIYTTPQSLRRLRVDAGGELYLATSREIADAFGLPFISQALESTAEVVTEHGEAIRNGGMPKSDTEVCANSKTNALQMNGTGCYSTLPYQVLKYMSKSVGGMCQGACSVGLSFDHRSTKTGAPDSERSVTCRRFAELFEEVKADKNLSGLRDEGRTEEVRTTAMERFGAEFHTPGHIFTCLEHKEGLKKRHGHTELSVAVAKLAGVTPIMVGAVVCFSLSCTIFQYVKIVPSEDLENARHLCTPVSFRAKLHCQ